MKGVNDVNQCSRQLGQGCGSHGGASNVNNGWAALPGVAPLRLTRSSVATVMLAIEAKKNVRNLFRTRRLVRNKESYQKKHILF